jgi:hypothetical protein
MNCEREYRVVCRGCKGEKQVAERDVQACLTALMCSDCGDERQPVVRAMARPKAASSFWRGGGLIFRRGTGVRHA